MCVKIVVSFGFYSVVPLSITTTSLPRPCLLSEVPSGRRELQGDRGDRVRETEGWHDMNVRRAAAGTARERARGRERERGLDIYFILSILNRGL